MISPLHYHRPKVLLVTGAATFGGSTYLTLAWAAFLTRQGCEVHVQCTDPSSAQAFAAIAGVRLIDTIHIPREVRLGQDLRAVQQLVGHIRSEAYDLVHTGATTAGFVGRLAAWLARTSVIVHEAHSWPVTPYSSLGERLLFTPLSYLAGACSSVVICVGQACALEGARLKLCPDQKLQVLVNGIDPRPFLDAARPNTRQTERAALGLDATTLVIGNANRLAPQKDNATLIRAMASLRTLLPATPVVLLLAGEGSEQARLATLVHELGLEQHVRFLGFRHDIPAFLAAVDIFASTSLWEGLSISLLEAMAAGKPVVTTNIPQNAELITHERTGLLVEPRSPQQVAVAIARFAGDPALARRCVIAARAMVLDHYTIERRLAETWHLYTHLLAHDGPQVDASSTTVRRR